MKRREERTSPVARKHAKPRVGGSNSKRREKRLNGLQPGWRALAPFSKVLLLVYDAFLVFPHSFSSNNSWTWKTYVIHKNPIASTELLSKFPENIQKNEAIKTHDNHDVEIR